jgi:sugar/nucleoside kinase (ribokinase family)
MNKNLMYDIITFGSATQDIYVKSKQFLPVSGKAFAAGKQICFALGSKVEVEDIFLSSGGGGTNTSATFANQGLKTAWCGQVGQDCFGNLIIEELKNFKIDTRFILKTKNKPTNTSVFLTYPGKDRTIMVYRGASDDLEKKDIPWQGIKNTKWFYLAPFSGKLANLTEDLINFAKKNKIKVVWNPG